MTKNFLTLILCTFCILTYGQNAMSVSGGLNLNYVRIGELPKEFNSDKLAMRLGFHAGINWSIALGKKLKFSPGLQYSQKGCKSDFGTRLILHYVEVPILFSWSPADRVTLDAGPTLAYNIRALAKNGSGQGEFDANKFDLGMNIGGSFLITDQVSLYARYFYGLLSFDEIKFRDVNNAYHETPQYNKTIQFGMTYRLKRGQ